MDAVRRTCSAQTTRGTWRASRPYAMSGSRPEWWRQSTAIWTLAGKDCDEQDGGEGRSHPARRTIGDEGGTPEFGDAAEDRPAEAGPGQGTRDDDLRRHPARPGGPRQRQSGQECRERTGRAVGRTVATGGEATMAGADAHLASARPAEAPIRIGASMRWGWGSLSAPTDANQGASAGASGHNCHFRPTLSMPMG